MTAPRLLLLVLAALATAVVVATSLAVLDARRPTPQVIARDSAAEPAPAPSRTEAVAVLADWDRRRAAAWAAGDVAALTGLYLPDSRAGREDAAMLADWTKRGLRVTGLRMQVRDVAVRDADGPRRVLVVTDRLAGGEAVGPGTRVALPADGWTTRRIALQRVAGEWRVASVRPVRPSAPR